MPSYADSVLQLFALGHELHVTPAHKFDLANMRVLLEALEHPQRRFASVLIAGTNGKGSTAATLASILAAAEHRTGLYTSPHLRRVNERIQVNGEEVTDDAFALVHQRVEQMAARLVSAGELPWHPSFFEVLTAMAFCQFAVAGVRIAVLEVGMGGRLDATNLVEPVVSVITDVALDHEKYLGNTIAEIGREKAGIIRERGVVVTLPQHPQANDAIGNTILERNARGVSAVPYVPPVSPGAGGVPESYPLQVLGETITIHSPLIGRHQLRNVALAIAAAVELNAAGFAITARDIERGIRETRWRGRFERITATAGAPEYVLDAAHNPAGAWALRSTLSERFAERHITLVFGAMRDKAIAEMAEVLFPLAAHVIATRAENPRSATPQEVRDAAVRTGVEVVCEPDVRAALMRARSLTPKDGVIVIAGSIYVLGEALAALEAG
ncbi:MAG: bifunctional folylpolyglutamate synthase/dihydrofolate synthase [Acidobacteria bacterium]|nr:bifunctional folylpolyglutamate synthase/dihydrofolate synthase [Acidobacteriota bacterium]